MKTLEISPPLKKWLDSLTPERRKELLVEAEQIRQEYIAIFEEITDEGNKI